MTASFSPRAILFLAVAAIAISTPVAAFAHDANPSSSVASPARVIPDTVQFDQEIANGNRVHMTSSNYGYYGNNFVNRSASLEFPGGSGYEHMVWAGLWVGARTRDDLGEFTGVTTGVLDGAQGVPSTENSEWTPGDRAIRRRSRVPTSPDFDLRAISDLDLICDFNDLSPTRAANNPEDHRSMGLLVHHETYQWTSPELRDALFFHTRIKNQGPALTDVWVGLFSELASGNKNAYVNWPPSSADPGGQGRWFAKAWLVYDAPRRMVREHYCAAQPIPSACQLERAPYWIGIKLLDQPTNGQSVTFAALPWRPGDPRRDQDIERYAILSAGTTPPVPDSLLPPQGDPVELLAIGPFPRLETGDSVTVDFAIVGGAEVASIETVADAAQSMFDRGYSDIPVPVTISRVHAVRRGDHVRIEWFSEMRGASWTIERRVDSSAWTALGNVRSDGSGVIVFEDHDDVGNASCAYRLVGPDGSPIPGSEAWVTTEASLELALAAPRPHPARTSGLRISFTLPRTEPTRLELFDLTGRRVWERQWSAPGVGDHSVAVERLPAGVFLARLTQGDRSIARRLVMLD